VATVAILGAGDIGGALAREIAALDLVSRIVIVDDLANVAAGKALDVAQSGPVDGYHTALSGTSDVAAVIGASAIVIADRAGSGPSAFAQATADKQALKPSGLQDSEWTDDAGLALLKRVAGLNQQAFIVCAGARQASIIEKGVNEAGVPRLRLFGSAPEALRSAVIAITAVEANAAPADISLSVLGRPPQSVIVPWDEASIAGRCAAQVLTAAQLTRLEARIARLWPPGSYSLAAAAARLVQTALTRSARVHAAQVAVTRDEGIPGRSATMPVTLHPAGIASLVPPALSTRDRVRFETSMRA
jgi:malate dehydrogenase